MKLSRASQAIKYYVDNGLIIVDFDAGLIYRKTKTGLKQITNKRVEDGYIRIGLINPEDKKQINVRVHKIVAYAAWGDIALQMDVDHIDTISTNNKLSNLQLLTRSEHTRMTMSRAVRKASWFGVVVNDTPIGCFRDFEDARLIADKYNTSVVSVYNVRQFLFKEKRYKKAR